VGGERDLLAQPDDLEGLGERAARDAARCAPRIHVHVGVEEEKEVRGAVASEHLRGRTGAALSPARREGKRTLCSMRRWRARSGQVGLRARRVMQQVLASINAMFESIHQSIHPSIHQTCMRERIVSHVQPHATSSTSSSRTSVSPPPGRGTWQGTSR
jgi:hypothetical protein